LTDLLTHGILIPSRGILIFSPVSFLSLLSGKATRVQPEQTYQIMCMNSGGHSVCPLTITVMDVPPEFYGSGYYNNPAE
jgi:hypothetical protein